MIGSSFTISATPTKHILTPDGEMLATIEGSNATATVSYIHTDHLTGSALVTNASGAQTQLLDYYPWGTIRINNQSATFNEKRKFAGHEYDTETGLSYMGARYYDTTTGRFLSEDPAFLTVGDAQKLKQSTKLAQDAYLSNPQHLNSYTYAFNNPMVNVDTTGEFSVRTTAVGLLQLGKAALGGGQIVFQATTSGMAYGVGYAPLGTVMATGALSNLDSAFVDSSNGFVNILNGVFTEKSPVTGGQGPIRDMVQEAMGDTKVFDGIALGANVLTFTGKETHEYVRKTGAAYKIFENARSAGVGQASLNYLAEKAAGFAFEAADVATQVFSGRRSILDHIESKLSSDKKNN